MRPLAVCGLVPLVCACVALAGSAREESTAEPPVILPPLPGPVEEPAPPPATTPTSLARVPVSAGHLWTGQYACLAGPVDLTVRVQATRGTSVQAVFEVPAGRYEAAGEYDPASGALELSPTRWLGPAGSAAMLGLYGTLSPDGALYEGRVTDPSCRWFTLRE